MSGYPRRLVLVRHGESEGNLRTLDERAQYEMATWEYRLTERGRQQAIQAGKFIKEKVQAEPFDRIFCSYYTRARETCVLLGQDGPVVEDSRLAEAQRGIYHALTQAELAERFPDELKRRDREGLYHYRPPGGENWPDVEGRIYSFLNTLSRTCTEDESVLIVGHSQWIMLFEKVVRGLSIDHVLAQFKAGKYVENASVLVNEWTYYGVSVDMFDPVNNDKYTTWKYAVPWREFDWCNRT